MGGLILLTFILLVSWGILALIGSTISESTGGVFGFTGLILFYLVILGAKAHIYKQLTSTENENFTVQPA